MITKFKLFENNAHNDVVKQMDDAVADHDRSYIVRSFIMSQDITDINDGSDASETLKTLLHHKNLDISYNDYEIPVLLHYDGSYRTSIIIYIFDNFIPDPNTVTTRHFLNMSVYSNYDDIFIYLISRPGFDPSYEDDALLMLCIDANRNDYIERLLKDDRVDINNVYGFVISTAIIEDNMDVVETILKKKTKYDDDDMDDITRRLYLRKPDVFKLVVNNLPFDLSYDDNRLLRGAISRYKVANIKVLLSRNDILSNIDEDLMKKLIDEHYLPTYKKRKIKRD